MQIEATVPEIFEVTRFPPKLKIPFLGHFLALFYMRTRAKKVATLTKGHDETNGVKKSRYLSALRRFSVFPLYNKY